MSITPGPWEVRGIEGDDWHNAAYGIVAENGDLVGFVTRRGTEEGLSNAHAIAAVPEALDILQEVAMLGLPHFDDKLVFNKQISLGLRAAEILRRIEGEGENAHFAGVFPQDEGNARG